MTRRQVILDSDDDGSVSPVSSPQKGQVPVAQSMNSTSNPAGTGSTDPVLFRKIYDDQYRAALQTSPQVYTDSAQLPALEDRIINQQMSSSPVEQFSVKRLKRSRTMHPSSLTSVTSPREPQQKAKRAKSLRDVDKLTQITSPGKSNDASAADIWEFPGSSDLKTESSKLRGKEKNGREKKTSGKLKRSKTVAHTQSSQPDTVGHEKSVSKDDSAILIQETPSSGQQAGEEVKSSVPKKKTYGRLKRAKTLASQRSSQSEFSEQERPSSKDDSHAFGRKRRASEVLDVEKESRTKKQKYGSQDSHTSGGEPIEPVEVADGTGQVIDERRKSSKNTRGKDVAKSTPPFPNPDDEYSMHTIQVPRTASEEAINEQARLINFSSLDGSSMITSPRMKLASEGQASITAPAGKSMSSISIIPATYSDSQKMLYESVSIPSTNQEHPSSNAEVDPGPQDTDPRRTAELQATPDIVANNPMRAVSSSPPITTASGKMKRAKSLIGSQASVSSAASLATKTASKKKRSKTMTSVRASQTSIDELSYMESQDLQTPTVASVPANESRKRPQKQPVERVSDDELLGSDETDLPPAEQYKPRPSRRRASGIDTTLLHENTTDLNINTSLSRPARKKSLKASKEIEKTADNGETSVAQSKEILASTETNWVASDNPAASIVEQGSSLRSENNIEFTGTNVEMLQTNSATQIMASEDYRNATNNTTDPQSYMNDIDLPDTAPVISASENDMSVGINGSEEAVTPVPTAAPKRRGRPPNANTASPALEKPTSLAAENSTELRDSLENSETLVNPAPKTAAPAKRRGRPPKSTEKVVEATEEVEVQNEDVGRNTRRADTSDQHSENQTTGPTWNKTADFLLPKSTPPQQAENTTALPLVTPTKNIKKGPDHSPLPSGKVPYRVGLSKRSRIAPLLKMIKK